MMATSIVVTLPELVTNIGRHLSQSDLYHCIQVNHDWNKFLIPLLWNSIDTSAISWGKKRQRDITITSASDDLNIVPNKETDDREQWLTAIFTKYGHHIKHLNLYKAIELEVIVNCGKCANLSSLSVRNFDRYSVSEVKTLGPTRESLKTDAGFRWVSQSNMRNWDESLEYRRIVENFFKLLLNNPGLVRVTLPDVGTMKDQSPIFIIGTLASMQLLKELSPQYAIDNLELLLGCMPQLQRLIIRSASNIDELYSMTTAVNTLRRLDLIDEVRVSALLTILGNLPGLKDLRIDGILPEPYIQLCSTMEKSKRTFPQLTGFYMYQSLGSVDKYMALLVARLPGLVRVRLAGCYEKTQEALYNHCYYLDEIHSTNAISIDPWRLRRAKDAESRNSTSQ